MEAQDTNMVMVLMHRQVLSGENAEEFQKLEFEWKYYDIKSNIILKNWYWTDFTLWISRFGWRGIVWSRTVATRMIACGRYKWTNLHIEIDIGFFIRATLWTVHKICYTKLTELARYFIVEFSMLVSEINNVVSFWSSA